jgi:hexulose-6-phosphate isomerase
LLRTLVPDAASAGVELHLETDFPPHELAQVLAQINHPLIKANYDIGNSASLGFDCRRELSLLAPWLGSVHVKDRVLGGGTVPLGSGAADLSAAFRGIRPIAGASNLRSWRWKSFRWTSRWPEKSLSSAAPAGASDLRLRERSPPKGRAWR